VIYRLNSQIADIFLYSILAWYFSQVWYSKIGTAKPFYFPLLPSYWFGNGCCPQRAPPEETMRRRPLAPAEQPVPPDPAHSPLPAAIDEEQQEALNLEEGIHPSRSRPFEPAPEDLLGKPTIKLDKLRKSFGSHVAVNNLTFNMYQNQIFALLGHNGAGKTTTINMLTGMFAPDYSSGSATVYDKDLLRNMDSIRRSLGVCPQHDVLFDNLTVRETIIFFSRLKGYTYEEAAQEASSLPRLFHLSSRLEHTGYELSGGQKRKLSVAIAVCGGSRFLVLDEPTAGMDPLARRELWDLLSSLRYGRTILLTTHYMDEADVLGDRIGIMSAGQLQCLGSAQVR
jgi:ATP-binding cassette subfamily A (ABC1) protein 3